MYKLKNCPFCNSSNSFVQMLESNLVCIECEDCGARSGPTRAYKGWQVAVNSACKKWNMRAKKKEKYDKYGKID